MNGTDHTRWIVREEGSGIGTMTRVAARRGMITIEKGPAREIRDRERRRVK